ncbi:unnamed protein product [Adineta ricciae]|uniref:G-protein coupled receptors family 1 profile domain-containing protein n=1 Tax=Adineta ricciae TaxID=249248 RepID=A0A814XJZ2_ADIRI|nr:unnamed protein product [Adineta ricciae]CAF1216299.1 unnamed protein product [Adineta ricciae]
MMQQSIGNSTIGWSSTVLYQNRILLGIGLLGTFLHSLLWFQLFFHRIPLDLSLIFPACYVSTDIFILLSYLVQYVIRSTATTPTWRASCYFEAYFAFYFNILESFYLTLLHICRYLQIVRNKNIYMDHRYLVLFMCIIVPALILMNMIIQHEMAWSIVIEKPGSSCSLVYTSLSIRVWNVIVFFCLPIILSFMTSIRSLFYVKQTCSQQMMIRRNHHRRLIYRFLIFFTIWFILWAPSVLLTFLDIHTVGNQIRFIFTAANGLEASIDGVLVIMLDTRFQMVWQKSHDAILQRLGWQKTNKVKPVIQAMSIMHDRTCSAKNNMHVTH